MDAEIEVDVNVEVQPKIEVDQILVEENNEIEAEVSVQLEVDVHVGIAHEAVGGVQTECDLEAHTGAEAEIRIEEERNKGETDSDHIVSEEDLHDVSVHYEDNLWEVNGEEDVEEEELEFDGSAHVDMHDRGLFDDGWESDNMNNDDPNSDESLASGNPCKANFGTFEMPKSMAQYQREVETYFPDKETFVEAIRTYGVESGRRLKLQKNDKGRCRVICLGGKGKCTRFAYCAYVVATNIWRLRRINDKHKCSTKFNVKLLNAKWLSSRLENTLRDNPSLRAVDIHNKVTRKWNIAVTKSMARRAKTLAIEQVDGSFIEQFNRIYHYAHEILRSNPGSTTKVKVEGNEGERYFSGFYMCLKACKDSIISCYPFIGLDGCFLKHKYRGELLTVVGRDTNDQMVPIACVVVEVENKDKWTLFLELLIDDLGGPNICASYTFMSNQQKVCILFSHTIVITFYY